MLIKIDKLEGRTSVKNGVAEVEFNVNYMK